MAGVWVARESAPEPVCKFWFWVQESLQSQATAVGVPPVLVAVDASAEQKELIGSDWELLEARKETLIVEVFAETLETEKLDAFEVLTFIELNTVGVGL